MALTKISTKGIKDATILDEDIASNTITAARLGNDCVGTGELQNSAVETINIQDQAVDLTKLPHGTSSNDGKFLRANNGADPTFETIDLTALSAANLTSGTIPDARFPATLPAASAANLTAVPAANITGTLPAISGANLTGISSDYVKLQHNSSSGGSAQYLVFNNLDVATYKYFDFTISYVPNNDNVIPRARFRTGTGSATSGSDVVDSSDYGWSYYQHWGTNNFGEEAKTSQVSMTLADTIGANSDEGIALRIRFHFANSNDTHADYLQNWAEWSFAAKDPDNNINQGRGTGAFHGSSTYPTGFQVYVSSGDINAHTYTLYGQKR